MSRGTHGFWLHNWLYGKKRIISDSERQGVHFRLEFEGLRDTQVVQSTGSWVPVTGAPGEASS